jgi:hypothetical protein
MTVDEAVNWGLPRGLCADRSDHLPHVQETGSLAPFICSADQDDREPMRSERRRGNNGLGA